MLLFTDDTAPHQLAFEAFGVELRVCANSPELLARAEPFLPPGWRPRPIREDQFPLTMLEGQIRGQVAIRAPERTFVHAGAIEHEGRAIIFPGHSFSGKTTLTEAFVRAGATYYSDEFAVLDNDGRVHPY